MKTLLVNPNNRNPLPLAAIEPPVWLSMMASHLIEDGREVTVLDAEAEDLSPIQTVAQILASPAEEIILVVMGNNPSVSSTPKMIVACDLLDQLKGHKKVWLTGLHPMAVKSDLPVLQWRPTKCLNIHWELLPMHLYKAHNWHCLDGSPREPYGVTYTSLGCPYDCYYCNIHTLYKGRTVLYRGTSSIVQEIDTLVTKHGIRNIKIWDELFALKEGRVLAICEQLKHYDLNMWAYARVDTVTEKMLHSMKKAGINWVAYGFETGSDAVRNTVNKIYPSSKINRAIEMTKDADINIIGNFIFGLPGETKETAKTTLDFAKRNLFEFVNFYVAMPYPGSRWYQETQPDTKWEDFNQYTGKSTYWSEFRDKAFNEYFDNPLYHEAIKDKFGEQGVEQIKDMIGYSVVGEGNVKSS